MKNSDECAGVVRGSSLGEVMRGLKPFDVVVIVAIAIISLWMESAGIVSSWGAMYFLGVAAYILGAISYQIYADHLDR